MIDFNAAVHLITALGQLIAQTVIQIQQSVKMSDEEKKQALAKLQADLDVTVLAVKNVRFDAIKKAD